MSKTNTCPQCGKSAAGNFCANCGASLGGRFCNQCGSKATPGSSFCNECGASLSAPAGAGSGAGGKPGASRQRAGGPARKAGASPRPGAGAAAPSAGGSGGMGWWVAGGMFVVIIFFMVLPLVTQDEQASSTPNAPFAQGGAAGAAGAPATTDLSSMTPREAADRLYERVMRAASANDSDQVTMFLPMSIQAYDMARPLDADGLFHLSRLQRMASRDTEALSTAVEGLEDNPDHLLNLYAAGDAALALGQEQEARQYLSRLLEAWDGEVASENTDYQVHRGMMPEIRTFAEQNVGG